MFYNERYKYGGNYYNKVNDHMSGCLIVKFDFCNSFLSTVHTISVINSAAV